MDSFVFQALTAMKPLGKKLSRMKMVVKKNWKKIGEGTVFLGKGGNVEGRLPKDFPLWDPGPKLHASAESPDVPDEVLSELPQPIRFPFPFPYQGEVAEKNPLFFLQARLSGNFSPQQTQPSADDPGIAIRRSADHGIVASGKEF